MQRPGADTQNMQTTDFICDYCRKAWDGTFPMVEGHQGALICGSCLTTAYKAVALNQGPILAEGHCTLCLEDRDALWASPAYEVNACKRCIKQGAGRLHKDPDWDWTKPTAPPAPPASTAAESTED